MLVLNIFFSPYTKRAEGERQWFCLVDYYVPFVGYDAICQMLVVRSIVSVEVIGSKHEYVSIWRRLSIYHLYSPLILTRRTVFVSSKFNFYVFARQAILHGGFVHLVDLPRVVQHFSYAKLRYSAQKVRRPEYSKATTVVCQESLHSVLVYEV